MLQDNPPDNPENSNFAHGNHRWTRKTMTMKTDTDFKSDNNALVSEKYLGMRHAEKGTAEEVVTVDEMPLKAVESGATPKYVTDIWLRVKSDGNGLCRFFYSKPPMPACTSFKEAVECPEQMPEFASVEDDFPSEKNL